MRQIIVGVFLVFSSLTQAQNFSVTYGDYEIAINDLSLVNQITRPVIHEDFEVGVDKAVVSGWSVFGNAPTYTHSEAISGKGSGISTFPDKKYNATIEQKSLGGLSSAYLSYYFKVNHLSGAKSRNIKLARFSSGYANEYTQPTGITFMPTNDTGQYYTYSTTGSSKVRFKWIPDLSDGQWHRAEYYVELSNPAGASNGRSMLVIDGDVLMDDHDVITEENGKKINWLTMPYYVAKDPGGDYEILYDNVYLSVDQSRVEWCDDANYNQCLTPIILRIKDITTTGVSVGIDPVNMGKKGYLFFFGKDGLRLNYTGVEICPGCVNQS